ncbi:F5/8 type C domain-containing protein [Cohnella sp. SGD-V74]|uniref:discoidin domain-containing protein n=1 Tax=unclassified Cohnella TaxID=2636738 RepID=UPI000D462AB3|nr:MULTISPECIES: discoidin domain-containing protein [unclassified Cohnella]PRX63391.1 F5/8 type C domain-containing protein [Cohnella sp. SGD-V74]
MTVSTSSKDGFKINGRFVGFILASFVMAFGSFAWFSSEARASGWTKLYTEEGGRTPFDFNQTATRGQKFSSSGFDALRVAAPSWGNNIGNLTLSLYAWNTDYATTTSQAPIARKTFVDYVDNAWLELEFPMQPQGQYLWELSNPTEWVGVYAYDRKPGDTSVSFADGATAPVQGYNYQAEAGFASGGWKALYEASGVRGRSAMGLTPEGNILSRGEKFYGSNFDTLRVRVSNYEQLNRDITLKLYAWNANYGASVAGQPIASKTFDDLPSDDDWIELNFARQQPGDYLWVLEDPSGHVGVWTYTESGHGAQAFVNGSTQGFGLGAGFDYISETYAYAAVAPGTAEAPIGPATLKAGETVEYYSGAPNAADNNQAYLFDWGDGTTSLSSTVKPMNGGDTYRKGRSSHSWSEPGSYSVKVRAYDQDGNPSSNWSAPLQVTVTGASANNVINGVQVYASSSASDSAHAAAKALDDNPSTYWSSKLSSYNGFREEHLAVDLGAIYTVDRLALTPRTGGQGFPRSLTLSYSTDGQIWHDVPIHREAIVPNPGNSDFALETGGLAARYFKITANRLGTDGQGRYAFQLAELQAFGKAGTRFHTSRGGAFDADWSNLYTVYGLAQNELTPEGNRWLNGPGGILGIGPTEWQLWSAQKLSWTKETKLKNELYQQMLDVPMDADGFVWAHTFGQKHLDLSKHYSNNPLYIMGVHRLYMWTRDDAMLNDPLPPLPYGNAPAYPQGVTTLLEKTRKAMDFILTEQQGDQGLLVIGDPDNNGTANAHASNYWDNYPMGYKSAYENVLFYGAVQAMAELEDAVGSPVKAGQLRGLLPNIKEAFNETFWDDQTGRYIGSIDINGVERDYGFTFLNAMAVRYGLADGAQADSIYEWLDGERIIPGETSTGADIYDWVWAPRANTVAIESKQPYWWYSYNGAISVAPGGSATYGNHLENGGAIFYTSYDDMMGRLKSGGGADSAFARMEQILAEFRLDELRRDPANNVGAPWTIGIVGEYPESGIVPLVMADGFLGITAKPDGLHIRPNLPTELDNAGLRDVVYAGQTYHIQGSRSAVVASTTTLPDGTVEIVVPNGSEYVVPAPVNTP